MSETKLLLELDKEEINYLIKSYTLIYPESYFYDEYFEQMIKMHSISTIRQLHEIIGKKMESEFKYSCFKHIAETAKNIKTIKTIAMIWFISSVFVALVFLIYLIAQ